MNSFGASAFTSVHFSSPKMNRAAVSGVPTVAERATSWNPPATLLSLWRPTLSCTPLLLSTRLCSSSTTTALRWPRFFLILLPGSTACSVSGVVTSTSGG